MTSSFGITPQRQRRQQVAMPGREEDPKTPEQPWQQAQRLGGQLLDKSSYQRDIASEAAFQQITNFLDKNGTWERSQGKLFDAWKEGAKAKADKIRQAESFYKSAAKAYDSGQKNAEITQALEKKGEFEAAKENRLNDPWTNFYYWDSKSDDIGRNTAIELKAWGAKDLDFLARMDETQRGLAISQKAEQLLAPHQDIPQNFRTAKIDKYIAGVAFDLKQSALIRAKEFVVEEDQQTAKNLLLGGLSTAANFNKVAGGTTFTPEGVQSAFEAHRNFLINQRGYSKRDATEFLIQLIKNDELFLDENGDQLNDIGLWVNGKQILDSLNEVKIDGIKLLDLKGQDKIPIREHLMDAMYRAGQKEDFVNTQYERQKRKFQREIDTRLVEGSNKFWTEFGDKASDQDIQAAREAEIEKINKTPESHFPYGISKRDAIKKIEELYPYGGRKLSPLEKQNYKDLANQYIATTGDTEIPKWLIAETKGTDAAIEVFKIFGKARTTKLQTSRGAIKTNVTEDYRLINDDMNRILGDNETIKGMRATGGDMAKRADRLVKETKARMQSTLRVVAKESLIKKYNEAVLAGIDITQESERQKIRKAVTAEIEASPLLSDIDNWTKIGSQEPLSIPELGNVEMGYENQEVGTGRSKRIASKPHKIEIPTNPQLSKAWAVEVSGKYRGQRDSYIEEVLQQRILIPEPYLLEFTTALSGGPDATVSEDARQWLHNISVEATGGSVQPWEALKPQLQLYEGEGFDRGLFPEEYEAKIRKIASLTNSVDVMTGRNLSDTGITATPILSGQNEALDFVLTKVGDNQLANNVPTPISGTVIYVSKDDENLGVNVVIRAGVGGPNNKRGDLIRIGGLAATNLKVGQQLTRGMNVGLQGDGSELNSIEGQSSTGSERTPGHVHFQMYHPGSAVNPTSMSQYSTYYQKRFWDAMFPSLYLPSLRNQVESGRRSALNTPADQPLPPG